MVGTDELSAAARERMQEKVQSAEGRTAIIRVTVTGTSRIAADLQDDEWLHAEMYGIATQVGAVLEKTRMRVQSPAPPDPEAQKLREAVAEAAAELAADDTSARDLLRTLDRAIRDIASGAEGGTRPR